jgi:DNA polymerase-3 subunit epsilon
MEYAIVDIETTGGYASGCGITEIAILIHDGQSVIERFETLINPLCQIPNHIQALTGIDDAMVAESPEFSEIAEQVYHILHGRIFVAHHVNFDFSFVKHFLQLEGYDLNVPKLCTVRLSRKIRPGLRSYSLGRLCEALDIPINNRHRAGGDAEATAVLFTRLLAWDQEGWIPAMLKKGSGEQILPPNLPRKDFEALPHVPGVYYFRDRSGKPVYIGKAKNLRKRVASHFTGHNPNPQRQQFLRSIHSITYERSGTELMALLLEATEIKRFWPAYNRAMKKPEASFGLYVYEDLNSYLRLAIGKLLKGSVAVHKFYRRADGINCLYKLVRRFGLCPRLCMLGACEEASVMHQKQGDEKRCCTALLSPETYNAQVKEALQYLDTHLPSFAIVDKGRTEDEQSCIWVEKGCLRAMGYISHYADSQAPEDMLESLPPHHGNHYMVQMIYDYAARNPEKIIQLGPEAEVGAFNQTFP